MINFACKQFKLEEIIKCGLGLTKADCKVFMNLLNESDWVTTESIAKKLDLNLSTVQRAVKKLFTSEILDRTQENLDGGGYIFLYRHKPKKVIKKIIMSKVSDWTVLVSSALDKW